VLIHHSGHGEKGRERGASTIATNADSRFIVRHDEPSGVLTLGHLKEKEAARNGDVFAASRVVVLGQDEDGDDVASLVVDETTERPAERADWKGALKQSDLTALRELSQLWLLDQRKPVQAARWRQALHARALLNAKEPDDSDGNRRAFQRIAALLRNAGMVQQHGKSRFVSYEPVMPGVGAEGSA